MKLDLETRLYLSIIASNLPAPVRQAKVIEGRDYAFDFYWPQHGLLLEVNGGTWKKGAHSTGVGLRRDATKQNLAAILGFRTMIVTTDMITSGIALAMVEAALHHRPVSDVINTGLKGYQLPFKST